MADESFNDQRPVVVGAIIVAAVAAIGLWYFLVFRPAGTEEELTLATPTPFVVDLVGSPEAVSTPEPAPVATPTPRPAVAATSSTPIHPTAPTGPGEVTAIAALVALLAGSTGLLRLRQG